MVKKITLEVLSEQLAALATSMEKGFAAVAEDISKLATKDDVAAVHMQVNSIEGQLRSTRTNRRLADLEDQVFGEARA